MEQTTYEFLFTGLTLLLWLAPLILLVAVSTTIYLLKVKRASRQQQTFSQEALEEASIRKVS